MKSWAPEFNRRFIEEYKKHKCLWNSKFSKDNSNDKEKAYQLLVTFTRENIDENANRDTIIKKIQCLRGPFFKELKKVGEAARERRIYKPKLYYFEDLLFLREHMTPSPREVNKTRRDNLEITQKLRSSTQQSLPVNDILNHEHVDEDPERLNNPIKKVTNRPVNPETFVTVADSEDEVLKNKQSSSSSSVSDTKKTTNENDVMPSSSRSSKSDVSCLSMRSLKRSHCSEARHKSNKETKLEKDDKHLEKFGHYVVKTLKKMKNDQRMTAMILITELLVNGEKNDLSL